MDNYTLIKTIKKELEKNKIKETIEKQESKWYTKDPTPIIEKETFKKAKKFYKIFLPIESKIEKTVSYDRPTKRVKTIGNFVQYVSSLEGRKDRKERRRIAIAKTLLM